MKRTFATMCINIIISPAHCLQTRHNCTQATVCSFRECPKWHVDNFVADFLYFPKLSGNRFRNICQSIINCSFLDNYSFQFLINAQSLAFTFLRTNLCSYMAPISASSPISSVLLPSISSKVSNIYWRQSKTALQASLSLTYWLFDLLKVPSSQQWLMNMSVYATFNLDRARSTLSQQAPVPPRAQQ